MKSDGFIDFVFCVVFVSCLCVELRLHVIDAHHLAGGRTSVSSELSIFAHYLACLLNQALHLVVIRGSGRVPSQCIMLFVFCRGLCDVRM